VASRTLKSDLRNYENSLIQFKNAFVSSSAIGKIGNMTEEERNEYLDTLNTLYKETNNKYGVVLSILDNAIAEYKEHNGLQ